MLLLCLGNVNNKSTIKAKSNDDTSITSQCCDTRIRHTGKLQKIFPHFPGERDATSFHGYHKSNIFT